MNRRVPVSGSPCLPTDRTARIHRRVAVLFRKRLPVDIPPEFQMPAIIFVFAVFSLAR